MPYSSIFRRLSTKQSSLLPNSHLVEELNKNSHELYLSQYFFDCKYKITTWLTVIVYITLLSYFFIFRDSNITYSNVITSSGGLPLNPHFNHLNHNQLHGLSLPALVLPIEVYSFKDGEVAVPSVAQEESLDTDTG